MTPSSNELLAAIGAAYCLLLLWVTAVEAFHLGAAWANHCRDKAEVTQWSPQRAQDERTP